jgi:hypothetical protein
MKHKIIFVFWWFRRIAVYLSALFHRTAHRSVQGPYTWWEPIANLSRLGFHRISVCFSGQNFELIFCWPLWPPYYLAWIFLQNLAFLSSPLGSKQQVLQSSSGTFSKASVNSFIKPWRPKTAAALPSQAQQLLKEFPTLLQPSAWLAALFFPK